MTCKECDSKNVRHFPAELTLCFDSLETTLNTNPVNIIPRVLVCLECGYSGLVIPQAEVSLLKHSEPAWTRTVSCKAVYPLKSVV